MRFLETIILLLTVIYCYNQLNKKLDEIDQKVKVVQVQVLAVHKYVADVP